MSETLDRLGMTESQLQALMLGRRAAQKIIVRIPAAAYQAAQDIRSQLRSGQISEGLAQVLWEQKVRPHIPLKANVDFDPAHDLICLEPKLPARQILTPL